MGRGGRGQDGLSGRAVSAAVCLDTSVVMRLLVREPAGQFQIAADFLAKQRAACRSTHVSDLVLAEAYFALQAFYKMPKSDALEALRQFARHSGVIVGASTIKVLATPNLANAKPGFVDRLIHGAAREEGHTLVTFEKAAHKLPATELLPPRI